MCKVPVAVVAPILQLFLPTPLLLCEWMCERSIAVFDNDRPQSKHNIDRPSSQAATPCNAMWLRRHVAWLKLRSQYTCTDTASRRCRRACAPWGSRCAPSTCTRCTGMTADRIALSCASRVSARAGSAYRRPGTRMAGHQCGDGGAGGAGCENGTRADERNHRLTRLPTQRGVGSMTTNKLLTLFTQVTCYE